MAYFSWILLSGSACKVWQYLCRAASGKPFVHWGESERGKGKGRLSVSVACGHAGRTQHLTQCLPGTRPHFENCWDRDTEVRPTALVGLSVLLIVTGDLLHVRHVFSLHSDSVWCHSWYLSPFTREKLWWPLTNTNPAFTHLDVCVYFFHNEIGCFYFWGSGKELMMNLEPLEAHEVEPSSTQSQTLKFLLLPR